MMKYTFKTAVWIWPGESAAWRFVSINKKLSEEIKAKHSKVRRGFGSIPVKAKIGKTTWETSIFPTREKQYILPLKAKVRKSEGVEAGDSVSITLVPRVVR